MPRKKLISLSALLTLALVSGAVAASPRAQETLARFVTAAGGGRSTSASYVLHGTVGQAATGELVGENRRLRSGFWAGPPSTAPVPTATLSAGTPVPTATATTTWTPDPDPSLTNTPMPTSTDVAPGTATPTLQAPVSTILLPWMER